MMWSFDISFYFLFFKRLWRTHVFSGGHWYPWFGFLVASPLSFKARVGSALFTFFVETNVMYIPWDPPLVLHMLTSWQSAVQLVTSPHASAEVGLGSDSKGQSYLDRRQMHYHCASDPTNPSCVKFLNAVNLNLKLTPREGTLLFVSCLVCPCCLFCVKCVW